MHAVSFDASGNGVYGPPGRGTSYPAWAFAGAGRIDGVAVRCLTAEYQMQSHTGYNVDDDDYRDVLALHKRFGIDLPEIYRRWLRE